MKDIYDNLPPNLREEMMRELKSIQTKFTGDGLVQRMAQVAHHNNQLDEIEAKYKKLIQK